MTTTATPVTRAHVLELCATLLQLSDTPLRALADHMAQATPPKPAAAAPAKKAAAGSRRKQTGPTPMQARVLETIDAAPQGATVDLLCQRLGLTVATAWQHLDNLGRKGLAIRCKVPGVRAAHWFTNPALARAWSAQAEQRQAEAEQRRAQRPPPVPRGFQVVPPKPAVPAPVHTPAPAPAAAPASARAAKAEPVVIPEDKITRIPTPRDRFAVDPTQGPLSGGFSTTPPGMNPLTGRQWGQP